MKMARGTLSATTRCVATLRSWAGCDGGRFERGEEAQRARRCTIQQWFLTRHFTGLPFPDPRCTCGKRESESVSSLPVMVEPTAFLSSSSSPNTRQRIPSSTRGTPSPDDEPVGVDSSDGPHPSNCCVLFLNEVNDHGDVVRCLRYSSSVR